MTAITRLAEWNLIIGTSRAAPGGAHRRPIDSLNCLRLSGQVLTWNTNRSFPNQIDFAERNDLTGLTPAGWFGVCSRGRFRRLFLVRLDQCWGGGRAPVRDALL